MTGTGITELKINDQVYRLKFNNYAREELAKYFIPEGQASLTQTELTEQIVKKWEQNNLVMLKNLVYAGIVGNAYITHDKSPISKAEVGEYVADAPYEELLPVWKLFLDASGINLKSEPEQENEPVKKKKKKTSKKS